MQILINCDLGECLTPNQDAIIMPLIDCANIACGGHIGNEKSMNETVKLAMKHGVRIGAHPSYQDFKNFGRVAHHLSYTELFELLHLQIFNFQKICLNNDAKLTYIKPHGALYHDMAGKPSVFKVICQVINTIDTNLTLMVPAGFSAFGTQTSVKLLHELFADRAYKNGKILPRSKPKAVLTQVDAIIQQYRHFSSTKACDSICFHSDNLASVEALKHL